MKRIQIQDSQIMQVAIQQEILGSFAKFYAELRRIKVYIIYVLLISLNKYNHEFRINFVLFVLMYLILKKAGHPARK